MPGGEQLGAPGSDGEDLATGIVVVAGLLEVVALEQERDDCGACEPECPVDAIFVDDAAVDDGEQMFVEDSLAFFARRLPGRAEPLGDPGGAAGLGELGVDTPYVASLPASGSRA